MPRWPIRIAVALTLSCGGTSTGDEGGASTGEASGDGSANGCTIVMQDTFERDDSPTPGNTEIPGDMWIIERGNPVIRDGKLTDGGGTEQTVLRSETGIIDESTVRIRFRGTTQGGLAFWAILNTQAQNPWNFGVLVKVVGEGTFEVERAGLVLANLPIAGFSPTEELYVEVLSHGATFDATVTRYAYAGEDGAVILASAPDLPTADGGDGNYFALSVFPAQTASRIEEITVENCPAQ